MLSEKHLICDHGCVTAVACSGKCQPPIKKRSWCKWCVEGWERKGDEHWVVKSVTKPTVRVYLCTAV